VTSTGGKALDRVVAVLTEHGQGSGVLLHGRLILTARHVVDDDEVVEVIHPSITQPVKCQVVWVDVGLDVALLVAASHVISPERAAPLGRMRFGRVATRSPLPECDIIGLPEIQRYGDQGQDLEYDHFRASVLPMAGRMRNVIVCELDRPAAEERDRTTSPLSGLSGAPVFAGPVLLGVVTEVPRGRLHHRIDATPVEAVVASVEALPWLGTFELKVEEITDVHPKDELFEARYAKDLAAQYRKTEIFGIEELGRTESRWDLDTAYLSLEAETGDPHRERVHDDSDEVLRKAPGSSAQRIDTLLTERPRVLLRGQAGAGKTTLVWWLAAHAANGTLNENLAELNGLVPFVIPMREVYARGGRFPAVSELLSAGRVITDDAPENWASRVLEAERGLLLVDGLDEVPPQEREKARSWLVTLLDRYPHTRCLATVRPDAVDKDWLRGEGFAELTLLPMSDEDIEAFVVAWHKAARLECAYVYDARRCGDERELLTSLEQDLVHQLEQNPALRDLARTPLLCAVICALHRSRRGFLPTTRWQLYRAALAMLLGGRDAGRGVVGPDDIAIDSDGQHSLLQRLAVWLVRTGQQQMTREEAIRQLRPAVENRWGTRDKTTPERVLRFLLERSGLLQERTDDAIQFIHRTFQDFLAAKEFHESGYFLELLREAGNKAWRDVIVLGVGHATRKDARQLIEKLVEFGDQEEERERKWYLHVLAAQCATSLQELDAEVMEVVRGRVGALMPLQRASETMDLAGLGAWAVEVLPVPHEGMKTLAALYTVETLARIRTAESRQKMGQFASRSDLHCSASIVNGWSRHPAAEYAREVLAGARFRNLSVSNSAQLAQLPHMGTFPSLAVNGSYSADALDAHLPTQGLESIRLAHNKEATHLEFLRKRAPLERLSVSACPALRSLSVLPELGLRRLELDVDGIANAELGHLDDLQGLDILVLNGVPHGGWRRLRPLPGLSELRVRSQSDDWFDDLEGWEGLTGLGIYNEGPNPAKLLRAASRVPRLTRLDMQMASLHHLTTLAPLPNIRALEFDGLRSYAHMTQLRRVFPNLKELTLGLSVHGVAPAPLDLTVLQDMPDLVVVIAGSADSKPRIVGAEAFGARYANQLLVL
jgi:hypothetical protein